MQQRFASISRHRPSHLTTISAKKRKNASCNRYGNILPFDQNAVKVKAHAQEGSRGSYINASLVQARRPLAHTAVCSVSCVVLA